MALNRLRRKSAGEERRGSFDIRRINLPETQLKTEPSSRELYEALKQSRFLDPESGKWINELNETGQPFNEDVFALNQILGLYVAALFNPLETERKFRALQQDRTAYHNGYLKEDGGIYAQLPAQFIGIILEGLFSPAAARKKFAEIKEKFYSNEKQLWRPLSTGPHVLRYATSWELYAGWMEVSLFPERAAEVLAKLRQSAFYDQEAQNWRATNDPMDKDTQLLRSNYSLLDILIESYVTPKLAYQHYQNLKSSPLYNPELHYWEVDYHPASNSITLRYSCQAQFLGIILKQRFEALFPEPPILNGNVPFQPLTKEI